MTLRELERYTHPVRQLDLTVVESDAGIEILVANGDSRDVSTVTIALGRDRQEAIAQAVENVEWLHDILQGPPPALKTWHWKHR